VYLNIRTLFSLVDAPSLTHEAKYMQLPWLCLQALAISFTLPLQATSKLRPPQNKVAQGQFKIVSNTVKCRNLTWLIWSPLYSGNLPSPWATSVARFNCITCTNNIYNQHLQYLPDPGLANDVHELWLPVRLSLGSFPLSRRKVASLDFYIMKIFVFFVGFFIC